MLGNLNIPWKKSKVSLRGAKDKYVSAAAKSLGCVHDWQFVQQRNKPDMSATSPRFHERVLGYCPLCKISQLFTQEDWDAVMKIQEIEKKYKR